MFGVLDAVALVPEMVSSETLLFVICFVFIDIIGIKLALLLLLQEEELFV